MRAAEEWRAGLAGWAIEPEILAAAVEPPWALPVELFAVRDEPAGDTPSLRRAREALPAGGSVLDVGCGGGAASLALAPPAGRLVGVDVSADMLTSYAAAAARRGVPHQTVEGRWPDVHDRAPVADVVVCWHVAYNVPDLADFAAALTRHARRRVVMELTATHPMTALGPLWRRFHGVDRPAGPTAEQARAVLAEARVDEARLAEAGHVVAEAGHVVAEAGLAVREERFMAAPRPHSLQQRARLARIRLCLPPEREAEVQSALAEAGPPGPRELVALWWDRPHSQWP